ncbi:MAG: annexin, partial [Pleurocapsa sp. SU_196_0]|nr:annexin [Pleurocapsa sp. SU_196_0]
MKINASSLGLARLESQSQDWHWEQAWGRSGLRFAWYLHCAGCSFAILFDMTRDRVDRSASSSQQQPKTALPQASQRTNQNASQPRLMFNLDARPRTGDEAGQQTIDPAKIERSVGALYKAMDGLGTDESAHSFATLSNKTPAEINAIKATYKARYGQDLQKHLREELSGADLSKAISLLSVPNAPT